MVAAALADSNVLIAATFADHPHHAAAEAWIRGYEGPVATCPITQGALLRQLLRHDVPPSGAIEVLADFCRQPHHVFWPDSIAFGGAMMRGVIGHRQVTDAYLVELAVHHGGVVATLDRGLTVLRPEATLLIES